MTINMAIKLLLLASASFAFTGSAAANAPPGGGGGGGTDVPAPIPPEKFAISPGGVDMRSGTYKHSNTDLSIGGKSSGLTLERTMQTDLRPQNFGQFFDHNWNIRLVETRVQVAEANGIPQYDYLMSIKHQSLGTSFRSEWADVSIYRQVSASGYGKLTFTGTKKASPVYTLEGRDGSQIVFQPLKGYGAVQDCWSDWRCTYPAKITQADGTVFTFEYDNVAPTVNGSARLRSVVSSRGFALLFEYNAPNGLYHLISKACMLNLAVTAKPASNICPAGALTSSYAYNGLDMTAATDASGVTNSYAKTGVGYSGTMALTNDGETSPYLTLNLSLAAGSGVVSSQQFATGESYSYNWTYSTDGQQVMGGTVTDGDGETISLVYGKYVTPNSSDPTEYATPGPEQIIDQLGRTITNDYCTSNPVAGGCVLNPLRSSTYPEGNSKHFTYDSIRNVTEVRQKAAGLPDIVKSYVYGCASPFCGGKPTTVTDAKGNVTTNTYDTAHGGVLSTTGSAVGGIAPQTRFEYAQRHAWIKDGAGGYEQAASPVWVLTKQESCKTSAASGNGCAGGAADEVATTYDYGPDSGPNNLLLRGVAVTADGQTLRTCYSYDENGRKLSETQPKGTGSSCP